MAEPDADEEIDARARAVLERLRADPEVAPLIAEIEQELSRTPATDRPEHHEPPPRRVAVAAAKVIVKGASLETIAEETGIPREEFVQLEEGDPRARTDVALRVLDQIDAYWASVPRTLGGTARIPVPAEAQAERRAPPSERPVNLTGRRVSVDAVLAAGEPPARAAPKDSGRKNVTGTERLDVPGEVRRAPAKNVTGTERLDVPAEVRDAPAKNITGTVRLASPPEEQLDLPLDDPRRIYLVVAVLAGLVALAWWAL